MIQDHLDKRNLHHAYLIEGNKEKILPEILEFVASLGIKTSGNPDFCQINLDSFKIEDARNLKSMGEEKGFSVGKKFFIVSANNFLTEAQGTLLKIFEEPIADTHFFLIVPDVNVLLPTLISRFYLIKSGTNLESELKQAEQFISLSPRERILFIKELLAENDEEEEEYQKLVQNSVRSKLNKFLNALEIILHNNYFLSQNYKLNNRVDFFEQIFKIRMYLRQPGSSAKSLLEGIALAIPRL